MTASKILSRDILAAPAGEGFQYVVNSMEDSLRLLTPYVLGPRVSSILHSLRLRLEEEV